MSAFVAAVTLAILKSRESDEADKTSTTDASSEREAIEAECAIHARRHNAIDLRVTVFLLGFLTITTGIIKDGARVIPLPLAFLIVAVSIWGLISCGVALYASRRNVRRARTPEQIISDALASDPLMVAAIQLSNMEAISFRKTHSTNIALYILIADSIMFCLGLVF